MAITRFDREIAEAKKAATVTPPTSHAVQRQGFVPGLPLGGTNEENIAQSSDSGALDRHTMMETLMQAYLACPWSAACVDVIARTCTAGGIQIQPNSLDLEDMDMSDITPPPGVAKVQSLLHFINPEEDVRQLMRGVVSDLLVYGDSFTEVSWIMGEPVALWSLDPKTIDIMADEHGTIRGYRQRTETGRKVIFEPHEVIHVRFDSPGHGLYGVSPTQKNITPITTWLFAAALVQETMRRGDPLRAWVDWPNALPESEMKRLQQQYQIRNLGGKNIGNLFETKGGATVRELATNRITDWLSVMQQRRDEMVSGYGVPPSKVSVVESGNIGGGTGTSQDKMFVVNTISPIQLMVMEKFSFFLLYNAYGISDWHMAFGEIDLRDDEIIETIRDMRIRNGSWTLNRTRADINEPPVEGGGDAILVDRQNLVLWADLKELSAANVKAVASKGMTPQGPATPGGPSASGSTGESEDDDLENIAERRARVFGRFDDPIANLDATRHRNAELEAELKRKEQEAYELRQAQVKAKLDADDLETENARLKDEIAKQYGLHGSH